MPHCASNVTQVDLDSSLPKVIASGDAINVYGITASNTGSTANLVVELQTAETTPTTLIRFELDVEDTFHIYTPFVADKGLQVTQDGSSAGLEVTIFHSNTGL